MVLNRRDLANAFSPNKVNRFGKRRSGGGGQIKPSMSGNTSTTRPNKNESQTNIKVIVRVRPPNEKETQENCRAVIKTLDNRMLIFDPKEEQNPFFYRGVQQKGRDLLKKQNKELQFIFDHIFDGNCANDEVFEGTTKDIITNLLDGYNCSVFAYGATGAGKTHTMLGNEGDPGITYRTMAELFEKIEEQRDHRDFNLGVTYLEIYNENVQDLLHKSGPLALREDARAGVIVANLKIVSINRADELLALLARGNRNRTQHPTDANQESSRSHAVFQVYVNISNKLDGQVKQVKLSMIDLAGSERASATGCKGARFKEGANINKSLLALGNCINKLADGNKHIPYRDSKLTRLLKDSLGGNCRTVMIANIGPSSLSYEDTYNTLRYANRAKKIKTNTEKNIINCQMHVTGYIKMVEELKKENNLLKQKLLVLESRSLSSRNNSTQDSDSDSEIVKKDIKDFSIRLADLYERKKSLNEKILSLQSTDKILCCRIQNKIAADQRLQSLKPAIDNLADEQNTSGKSRVNKSLFHFKRQRDIVKVQMESVWSELREVEQELNQVHVEMKGKGLIEKLAEKINFYIHAIEKSRLQSQYEHSRKISSLQQCELESTDTMARSMSRLLPIYYNTLCGHNFMTDKMNIEYKQLIKSLEGVKSVKWADSDVPNSLEDLYSLTSLSIEQLLDPINSEIPIHDAVYLDNYEANRTIVVNTENSAFVQTPKKEETATTNLHNSTITIDSPSEIVQHSLAIDEQKADALNNTFNLMDNSSKKRVLSDKNRVCTKNSSPKQKKISPPQRKVAGNTLSGKENSKNGQKPPAVMSARSVAILNKLKTDRPKIFSQLSSANFSGSATQIDTGLKAVRTKERRGIAGTAPYQKIAPKIRSQSAAPSTRVPWQ